MEAITLKHTGDGHWCFYHTLWLGTFRDDPNVYVCWTRNMDEMGGHPVEVTLERVNADSRKPANTRSKQIWQFRDGNPVIGDLTGWERLGTLEKEEWESFIAQESHEGLWQAIYDRLEGKLEFGPMVFTVDPDKALQYRQFMNEHDATCKYPRRFHSGFTPTSKYMFTVRETGLGTSFQLICDCGEKYYADAGDLEL